MLPTTDTPRGLVLNMGDVLFNVGKADLLPPAQLALARLSGILSNYPSLHLSIEGYTDSTGAADFNQKLSEASRQRADIPRSAGNPYRFNDRDRSGARRSGCG